MPLRLRMQRAWQWAEKRGAATRMSASTAAQLEAAHPPLALNLRGLLLAASVAAVLAFAASTARVLTQHQALADDHAQLLTSRLGRTLERIEDDLSGLVVEADLPGAGGTSCSAALTSYLVRRSLDSTLVRRFAVQRGALACGALGEQAPQVLPKNEPGVHLTVTTAAAPRLDAHLTLASGLVALAEIDTTAFKQRIDGASDGSVAVLQAQLRTSQGVPLLTLDRNESAHPAQAWVTAHGRSRAHPVVVVVAVDNTALVRAALLAGTFAVLLAWFVVGLIALWHWRQTLRRARLHERLVLALRRRQFEPYVQPVLELATGRCVGGEILMRWNHPERGVLAPGGFIEEAERSGLIVPMMHLVMDKAAHRLAALARADRSLQFAFNITPTDLRQRDFVKRLGAHFNDDTLPASQVVLELTEREFVDPQASAALAKLKAGGWRIAMDDFGTGHSSLAVLEQVRVDRIKIDRAFVSTIDAHTVARPVLDAIIALGTSLQIPLIAEGIETEAQREYLVSRGVQYAQGFLFARPMPMAEFERWLADRALPLAEQLGYAAQNCHGAPLLDEQSAALWRAMHGNSSLKVRDRTWRARIYKQCFVGSDAVDWIVNSQHVDRAQAVQMGRRLMALGLIRHALDEHDFKDEQLFYSWVEQDAATPQQERDPPPDLGASLRGEHGAAMQTFRRGTALHRRCATGRVVTDWIVQRYGVSRETAVAWGGQLMRLGQLHHVFHDRPFTDSQALFRPN